MSSKSRLMLPKFTFVLKRHYSAENINSVYLKGVFPSLATPFDRLKNEPIAWDKFESNLRRLIKLPFAGFALHGFYGEYPYLTNDERAKIVRFVRTIVGDDKPIIVGSSSECKLMIFFYFNDFSFGSNKKIHIWIRSRSLDQV